jgi:hypothetical protein
MKYFAKLDLNNTVINVVQCDDDATEESMNILLGHTHKETWKDGSQRQRYAQKDGTYDPAKDVFIDYQTYPSWSLDSNNEWQAPVAYPNSIAWGETDVHPVEWDEDNQRWYGSSREDENGNGVVSLIWDAASTTWIEA